MITYVTRPAYDDLPPEARRRWDEEHAAHGMTHMKQTLLRSAPAFDALMTWYPLRDALIPFIGERGTIVVSHAISTANECLICSLYFRRALLARGDDPSGEPLSPEETDLAEFGRGVASQGRADDAVTARIRDRLGEEGLVLLVAFAGLMVATNIVNEALGVDPDQSALELFEGPDDPFAAFAAAPTRNFAVAPAVAEQISVTVPDDAAPRPGVAPHGVKEEARRLDAEPVAAGPRPGEFAGKTVLITGAGSGQGRGVARAFAAQGANVIGFDRLAPLAYPSYLDHQEDGLEALAAEIGADHFLAARGDVRDLASLEQAVAAGVTKFGGLDIVFANAGICAYGLSHELTDREWGDMIDINLGGVWHTTRAATPALVERGGGVIITNSSIGGLRGMRRLSHYSASKWGVIGLTKSLAIELAPHGIRAVSIHPTGVDTQMNDGLAAMEGKTPEEIAEASAGNLLPVPWVETADVAELVLFLASDRARYITGAQYVLDAGLLTA
ncbi:SDR family oxidoreductase [Brooklawnia cerclae]|uniref:NAD(P)-dependent dehydrogenase (Short-subunit alcohol dehydrogenase family) n=1 Tax=Brooklawnia cerclae TaxID=349934 RepID=A0ABX0SFH0_9ACTN|nr:SDR family oxidoreductase [Brooklawnia cerclae]NIH57140.1 NAD(P)-dependent dehydrogenase (short-subunit alcohol dehydrogenase family) [Brooklawnia cerclae]